MTNEAATRSYVYDALGRVTQSMQQMGAESYVFKYTYNLADGLTQGDKENSWLPKISRKF